MNKYNEIIKNGIVVYFLKSKIPIYLIYNYKLLFWLKALAVYGIKQDNHKNKTKIKPNKVDHTQNASAINIPTTSALLSCSIILEKERQSNATC